MPETAGQHAVQAIVGPTASGKSDLALAAAERLGAEIVAVDAFTVYRGMDIGTAKPPPAVRARVPHHCMNVLDPSQECTVEWFQAVARAAIATVRARGAPALLVGGSGLYFRAVVDDLRFPPTDPQVRAALVGRYADAPGEAWSTLHARDPAAAARIDPANARRAIRALEVLELTGRPFSEWRVAWDRYDSVYPGLRVVGVDVARDLLAARIDARVDAMLEAGLVQECRELHSSGPLSVTARQAIGYQEVFDYLEGRWSLQEAVAAMKARTRRYATRQQRWFSADPRVRWLAAQDVVDALTD